MLLTIAQIHQGVLAMIDCNVNAVFKAVQSNILHFHPCAGTSQRVGQLKLTYSPCSAKHIKGAEDQFPEDHNGARKTNRTALGNNFHRQNSYFICKGTDDF